VNRFRGGLVFKAHRLLYHSTLGSIVIKKNIRRRGVAPVFRTRQVDACVALWGLGKVDVRLPGKGNPITHGARPVHLIITMIKWIRTSRLSIKNSVYMAMKTDASPPSAGRDV